MRTEQRLRELAEKPKNWRAWLLLLAVLAQLGVLAGMYLLARYPVWAGEAVRLQVVPVDPRDLFRGNYARLNYAIGVLPVTLAEPGLALRNGQRLFVSLREDAHGLWQPVALHARHPGEGTVLRGRVNWASPGSVRLTYGIEAWFAPKEKALALEDDLRSGGVATVMVTRGGRAALVAIDSDERGEAPGLPAPWEEQAVEPLAPEQGSADEEQAVSPETPVEP